MSLFRVGSFPQDPPYYQGGEVPQPQRIKSSWQQYRVVGRTSQSLPAKTRDFRARYICKYLENNNISSIADFKKINWSEFSEIYLSKNMLTKVKTK